MRMCSIHSDFYPRKIKASTPSNLVSNFNAEFNLADFYYKYKGFIPASSQYRLKIREDDISSYRLIS